MRQGYHMSLSSMLIMFVQFAMLSITPSGLIVPVYMFVRGMNQKPEKSFLSWLKKLPVPARIVSIAKKYYTYT